MTSPDDETPGDETPDASPTAAGETAARLAQAMHLAGLGLIDVDYDAGTAVADAAAAALFGLPAGTPVPRAMLHARFHPDDRAAVEARIIAATAGSGAFTFEHRVVTPDGAVAFVHVRKRTVYATDAGGERRAVRAIAIVADRTEAHGDADRARADLQIALDAAQLGRWDVDADTGTVFRDARAQSFHGLPAADVTLAFDDALTAIHPDDRDRVSAAFERTEATGEFLDEEFRTGPPDGPVRWARATGRAVGGGCMAGVVRDVTDQKEAALALARSRRRLQLALLVARLGTFEYDPDSDEHAADARAREILGLDADEPLAAFAARVHPDDRAAFDCFTSDASRPGPLPSQIEYRLVMPGGTVRWIEGAAWARDDGRGVRVVGTVRDVTDRREAAAEIERSEARYRLVLDSVDVGFCLLDVLYNDDGAAVAYRFVETNPAFEHQTGLMDVAGKNAYDVVPGLEPFWAETYAAVAASGEPVRFTNGSEAMGRWFDVYAVRVGGPGSVRVAVLFTDVTAQRRALAALRESEARAQRTLDGLPVFAGICAPDGTVEYINRPALDVHGVALADVVGQPFHETIWWAGDAPTQARVAECLTQAAAGAAVGIEAPYHVDGDARTVEFGAFPLFDADGAVSHVAVSGYDVTERTRAQAELRGLNDALEGRVAERTAELLRSNAELDQFAYVASHDLKAPLRAIDSLASWIAEDAGAALPPESARHLALLRSRAERMERLLDSLLAYSRAGRQEDAVAAVDTAALVRETVALVAPPKGVDVRIEGDFPTVVTARVPLELVVRNLVANAIKHGRADGRVTVSARTVGGWAEFTVADDGPGIAEAYRERVFGMFQTLRPRDEVEGSGMGLAIVRKTVEARGGHVTLGEPPGGGASFRFTWPLKP